MKQNIFFISILLFIVGCGAQNNPKEPTTPEGNNGLRDDTEGSSSSILLPNTINIEFPQSIENSPTLKENVQYVKNITNIMEENLALLREVMPQIVEECKEKSICNFQKNHFIEERNISIGEIDFIKYEPTKSHQYEIILKLTEMKSLTYQWSEEKKNVMSTYSNKDEVLALHYFNDSNNSEALYINDTRSNEKNAFIISLEENPSSPYHLRYNHLTKNHQNFSSNIIIENEMLVENSFQINETQTIFTNLKDGDYLLLPPNISIKALNFIDILTLSEGSFSIFNGGIQGFLYADDFSDNLEVLGIFQLPKTLVPFISPQTL